MRDTTKRAIGTLSASAVIAVSIVGVAVGMASLKVEQCIYPEAVACEVDHAPDGIAKDSRPLDARMPAVEVLPACPTEDSPACYWDASDQGNGDGHDVVNPPEK